MSKICSERMKGRQLTTAFGTFTFDADGIAEVPDEHVDKLLAIKGYKAVGAVKNEEKAPEVKTNPPEEEKPQNDGQNDASDDEKKSPEEESEEENSEEETDGDEENSSEESSNKDSEEETKEPIQYTLEDLEQIKNVQQLKKIAKDNNIDLAGATKRDEIIPIILGAMN